MDRETADEIKRHFEVVAGGLRSEIGDLRTEVGGLRSEIRAVDEKADRRFDAIDQRFEKADGRFDAIDQRFEKADGRFDAIDRRFDETDGRFDETDGRFDDLKRHFDVVGESLRSDIRLVAEGVAGLDEKFTREFVTVREEMREQIGDVKSLIRASYGDLDRRVQALERKPS